ncbi:MAG: hypothetical protein ABSH02_08895 [Candidatus Sulfotelmatobacter sp.]
MNTGQSQAVYLYAFEERGPKPGRASALRNLGSGPRAKSSPTAPWTEYPRPHQV